MHIARPLFTVLFCAAALAGCAEEQVAAGPACPTVDAATFAAEPYKTKASFDYGGAVFSRALGNASCEDKRGGALGFSTYQVCDFTSPVVLSVKMPSGQETFYTPGIGKPVRVTVRDGTPVCEMTSR